MGFLLHFPQGYTVSLSAEDGKMHLNVSFAKDKALPLIHGYEKYTAALRLFPSPNIRKTIEIADKIRDGLRKMIEEG